jgi:hypothetical protein
LACTQARFDGRSELGDGEFAGGLRELLRSGFFKPPAIVTPHQARRVDGAPIE